MNEYIDRRHFIQSILTAGVGILIPGLTSGEAKKKTETNEEVTPGEDLMREHGALERMLLIYEETDRRNHGNNPQFKIINETAHIIRSFVENYHEKLEEDYIFPQFTKAGREVDLVKTLKTQHDAGRRVTTQIMDISSTSSANTRSINELSALIHKFIRMYRPHMARENTVVFREFPDIIGHSKYEELGEKFEDREHQLFGKNGFVGIVNKIAAIEKRLDIYNLSNFTPR